MDISPTKLCARCKSHKLLSEFYNNKKLFDGKTLHCKACFSKYRAKKIDKIKRYSKEYYRENRSSLLGKQKDKYIDALGAKEQYYQKNKSRIKQSHIERKEQIKEYQRLYYLKNKEKIKKINREQARANYVKNKLKSPNKEKAS